MNEPKDAVPAGDKAQALQRTLVRISEILECPISDLFGSKSAAAVNELVELVRLWQATTERQGKERILAVARQEAERSTNGEIGRSPAP